MLISSHHLAEVEQLVDRVIVMEHGQLVAAERLEDLTRGGHSLEDAFLHLTGGAER